MFHSCGARGAVLGVSAFGLRDEALELLHVRLRTALALGGAVFRACALRVLGTSAFGLRDEAPHCPRPWRRSVSCLRTSCARHFSLRPPR